MTADNNEPDWVASTPTPEFLDALRKGVDEAIKTAGPDYGRALAQLEIAVNRVPVFDLVCTTSLYFLTVAAGTNPEFDRPEGVFQHHVELIQAFALREEIDKTNPEIPLQDGIMDVTSAATSVTDAFVIFETARIAQAKSEEEKRKRIALSSLRLHVALVRGAAYHSISKQTLLELFEPLDGDFSQRCGVSPGSLIEWWWAVCAEIEGRIREHRELVKSVAELPLDENWPARVEEVLPRLPVELDEELVERLRADEEQRRAFAIIVGDLNLYRVYGLTLDQLAALYPGDVRTEDIQRVLEVWSLKFGDTGDVGLDQMLVANPVSSRPIIELEDHLYLWPLSSSFHHSAVGMLERVFRDEDDLWEEYLDRRGKFLERSVEAALTTKFPGATVLPNFKWVNPEDGKEYETDLLVLVESTALVVESKGGRISKHSYLAKGRPLREDINALIVEPSRQAHRLAELIANGEQLELTTDDGEALTVDTSHALEVVTLGVTLEPMAAMLPDLREIIDTGFTAQEIEMLSYSLALSDLKVILEILDHPSEVIHYLRRRGELENGEFLGGDEIDLLGFYLQTGFNLGEAEFSGEHELQTFGLSDPIDVYYYSREADLEVEKPGVRRTEWWEKLLTTVEEKLLPYWTEIGHILCNVAYEEQEDFRTAMDGFRSAVKAGDRGSDDFILFANGPEQRRDFFIGIIASDEGPEQRAQQIQNAARQVFGEMPDVERVLAIAWSQDPSPAPYKVLALVPRD